MKKWLIVLKDKFSYENPKIQRFETDIFYFLYEDKESYLVTSEFRAK